MAQLGASKMTNRLRVESNSGPPKRQLPTTYHHSPILLLAQQVEALHVIITADARLLTTGTLPTDRSSRHISLGLDFWSENNSISEQVGGKG